MSAYQILESIGAGGTREVYVAEDGKLSRKVALRVLTPEMAAHPERLMRFQRGAKGVAALDHPHACTLHKSDRQDGTDFPAMEHLSDETLSQRLRRGGVSKGRFDSSTVLTL